MATVNGTATNNSDLLDRLVSFLSTNATLVSLGQQWAVLRNSNLPINHVAPTRIAFSTAVTSYPAVAPDAWPINMPSSNVKFRIKGKINVPTSGSWGFCIRVGGSCQVRIGGVTMTQTDNNISNTLALTHTATLTAGVQDIEVDVVRGNTGNGGISLSWRTPGGSTFSIIPAANFTDLTLDFGSNEFQIVESAAHLALVMACREVMLRGPGLAGDDEIFIGMREIASETSDYRTLSAFYATGYSPQLLTYGTVQAGGSKDVFMPLWQTAIPYWFVANGRRFIVIAKISTTYSSMYGGFFLPYGTPSEYPYPICIGGTMSANLRWSAQTAQMGSFWNPCGLAANTESTLYARLPGDGSMGVFKNIAGAGGAAAGNTYPHNNQLSYRPSPDMSYPLQPTTLYTTAASGNIIGELQGVNHISGFSNASENHEVIGGVDHLVVQASFRTTAADYAAIRLE